MFATREAQTVKRAREKERARKNLGCLSTTCGLSFRRASFLSLTVSGRTRERERRIDRARGASKRREPHYLQAA